VEKHAKSFNKAVKLAGKLSDSKKIRYWLEQGRKYEAGNEWYYASKSYKKVLEIEPINETALQYLGSVYHRLGDLENTIENYERLLELNPENITVSNNLTLAKVELQYRH
jgi:tetratricopeptide (TPR) repeat protein